MLPSQTSQGSVILTTFARAELAGMEEIPQLRACIIVCSIGLLSVRGSFDYLNLMTS